MKQIEFKAVWNPKAKTFAVKYSVDGHIYGQTMTEREYRKFCMNLDTKMHIAGTDIQFEGGVVPPHIVDYFRATLEDFDQGKQ